MCKKKFVTYKESQAFAIENNIQSSSEWRKFRKSEVYPKYPENTYKNEWTTWGDFLCNGRIADNLKIFLSYEEAKLFLSTLNLSSSREYKKWWRKEKPNNLPSNAENTYKKQNVWVSWEDFLSFDRKDVIFNQCSERWMPFDKLKELIYPLNFSNKKEFKKWQAECGFVNIPSCPEYVYKNLGLWNGWNDFLGTAKRIGIDFKSYEDAKTYLRQYSFKSFSEYREWHKNNTHINIPANPEQYYKKCGTWVSMSDYLSNNNVKNKTYFPYEEAKQVVSKIGLKSVVEYIQWWKNNLPQNIPRKPEKVYSTEWTCWGDFLGRETIVGNAKKYVSYKEAETRVQEMGFKKATEFKEWIKKERVVDIPSAPNVFYKYEWVSWPIFLGNSNVHKWDKNNLLPFKELKDIVHSNHITSVKEYTEWYKHTKIKGVPFQPQKQYQDEWVSWGDFLGIDYTTQNEREFYTYNDCAEIVRSFNFTGKEEFFKCIKTYHDKKIPRNPVSKYKNEWVSWGDFLGTNRIANQYLREYKLSLLKCDDLIHMSSHQLIEIIANKKLPTEFKSLAYTHQDSESRVGAIRDLIDLFNDDSKTDDEIENKASEKAQNIDNELSSNSELNNEFNLILGDSDDVSEDATEPSLPSMVIGNAHAFDDLVHMRPSDEAAKFLVLEEIHRIWNVVLRANEEGKLDEVIEQLMTEDGGEFWKYIQTTFINEFNEVVSIEKGADYKFPYDPSLMQKLMVYYLTNNKSFGNWCGTGAGKTNAFLFATRKTNSRVTVAIVPNDVIDTLVKSINKIYPDSVVIVPQSSDELFTYDRNKFTYIIYNYEKFQGNNGAEETINRLLETNTIDFICLDEVQNVKVRDIETASSRSQFINSLVQRGRIANPEMRTLAMSATPCINNLTEVRSIIELLTGVEHEEIGNRNTIANIHNAYKALLLNGFRYVPKYPIDIEERTVEVDCSNDAELYLDLINKENGDISGIEYVLAEKKLESVKNELKPGTIVYATWVDGISELLTKNIIKWGFSVESYNGGSGNKDGRKEILERFLNGKTDVLVCSKPISTGVDGLQYKCNKMIIVSLPWTDADYTQLKGRIYRQGSKFKHVEFVIPQIVINTPNGIVWSWDKMRKHAIDTKKSLGSAVVDGYIQKTYTINKEKLLSKAMEALKDGLIDIETERTPISTEITYIMKEREYSESFINDIHSLANRSSSQTTHKRYANNPDEFKEYHRQREISKESWVEDPVDRVADIINSWSNRYTRIIDMGCGMNKLKTVVNSNKTVQGVDHMNVSLDVTVIEADMSNLNGIVDNNSKDVAVFCLSLWGVNYKDYFTEAYRILDNDGRMIIVEPSSKFGVDKHFSTIDEFVDDIENYGFERTGKVETHNNFVYLKFTKI